MRGNLKRWALLFVLLSMALSVRAQSPNLSQCASLQTASEQRTKIKAGATETGDGTYWFSRGYELHQSGRYLQSIPAFAHAAEFGYRPATTLYNIACGFARLNDKENALTWLERALANGFNRTDLLRSDADLDSLRADPRFQQLIGKAAFLKREDKPAKDKGDKHSDRAQEAVNRFEELRRESSTDGQQWYKVGSRLLQLRDFDRAVIALTAAVDHLGYRGSSAMYNLACTYALKGDQPELALKWLERSVNAGFDDADKFQNDADLASLHGTPRFQEIARLSRTLSLSQFNGDSFDGSNYSKQRWAPAIELYETFLRSQPNNGRAWFNLGYALHYSRRHTKAIEAFERAIQLDYRPPTSMYNVACGYAMLDRRDAAFEWLDKSVGAGFEISGYINGDHDLDNLRTDARFGKFADMASDQNWHKEKKDK
ncbi:MAG: eukaryotic-like serine/threonine-protein kinase [Blastocatellia bacterium]